MAAPRFGFLPPDPEHSRRTLGLVLWCLGVIIGGALLQALFLVAPLAGAHADRHFEAIVTGGALAFPAVVVYLTVPRLLDRYDPEPGWALLLVFVWGATAACGFSATINSAVHASLGATAASVLSAPIVEEFFKALALFAMRFFWKREFDGVVDGIIYATFVALGFAAVENVVYYTGAGMRADGDVTVTFVMRGILTPWAHPLFTSMTGIGFGLARESERRWVRVTAPFVGYFGAVLLHMIWNGSAALSAEVGVPLPLLLLPLWLLFVLAFLIMVAMLVRRRGALIRKYLEDEVALRNLTVGEVFLVGSAFGLLRVGFGANGALKREFVRAAARLALSKWHADRAMRGQIRTVSWDFIVPLRERLKELRARLGGGALA